MVDHRFYAALIAVMNTFPITHLFCMNRHLSQPVSYMIRIQTMHAYTTLQGIDIIVHLM